MERRNNRIRITPAELDNPRWGDLAARFVKNTDDPTDTFLYFVASPVEQEPWRVFLGVTAVKPALPPDFLALFGDRPIGDLGLINEWQLSLASWGGVREPIASPDRISEVELNFESIGMGEPVWFAVNRDNRDGLGAVALKVAFPESEHQEVFENWWPKMYFAEADLAVGWPQHVAADYQQVLRAAGIEIPPDQLVSFMGNRRITSAGH